MTRNDESHRSIGRIGRNDRRRSAFTLGAPLVGLAALVALGGCGELDDAGDRPATRVALDQGALDNVLLNEREMKSSGYALEGRAWLHPHVSLSMYADGTGAKLVLETMRAGALAEAPDRQPLPGESFWTYIDRIGGGAAAVPVEVASGGPNVLLFDPRAEAVGAGVALVQGAIVGQNDRCNAAWYNSRCGEWAGYSGYTRAPFISYVWSLLDRTSAATQPPAANRNAIGVNTVACADRGVVELRVNNTNPRFGSAPASVTLTLNEGFAQRNWMIGGWRQRSFCSDRFLGICIDDDYRTEYQTFESAVTVTPRSAGAEAHFCGRFSKHNDEVTALPCGEIAGCPLLCSPGSTNSRCRM